MPMTPPQKVVREETTEPTKKARPEEVAHDETPSQITDHKFSPKGYWWGLRIRCGLGEAAHAESELHYVGDDMPDD